MARSLGADLSGLAESDLLPVWADAIPQTRSVTLPAVKSFSAMGIVSLKIQPFLAARYFPILQPEQIILDSGFQRQSPVVQHQRLWQRASQEDGATLAAGTSLSYKEYDILSALQSGGRAVKFLFAVNRLLVDFEDDVPAG